MKTNRVGGSGVGGTKGGPSKAGPSKPAVSKGKIFKSKEAFDEHVLGRESALKIAEMQCNALRVLTRSCNTCQREMDESKKFEFAAVALLDPKQRIIPDSLYVVPYHDLQYKKEVALHAKTKGNNPDRVCTYSFRFI